MNQQASVISDDPRQNLLMTWKLTSEIVKTQWEVTSIQQIRDLIDDLIQSTFDAKGKSTLSDRDMTVLRREADVMATSLQGKKGFETVVDMLNNLKTANAIITANTASAEHEGAISPEAQIMLSNLASSQTPISSELSSAILKKLSSRLQVVQEGRVA